ncbi:MAG: hypothetical protein HZC38_05975 [Chloroflexi bacterium]|nr:hypothetical protein [Chloroflexota bacterium]
MITTHINPPYIQEQYLRCLNQVFGNWGDAEKYFWYFHRQTAYPKPDVMVLKNGEQLLAGSGVSYRRIRFPNGGEAVIGIMSGSWTLPEARGQGCFTRIIEESIQLTAQKGGAMLIAFVTEDNASFRQLAKAGAALFPSAYIFSTPDTPRPKHASALRVIEKNEATAKEIQEKLKTRYVDRLHFVYPSPKDLSDNFFQRAVPTEVLQDETGSVAVIETKPDTYLLQLFAADNDETCIANAVNHAFDNNRKFFMFSTCNDLTDICKELGLGIKPGYVTVLMADESKLRSAKNISSDWAGSNSTPLTQPESEWFLGEWDVQSGDRT